MTISLTGPLLLVGAGRMGTALLKAWISLGLDPKMIFIQETAPSPEIVKLCDEHGIGLGHPPELPEPPALIVLAVKPQVMNEVLPGVVPLAGPDTLFLSIAAGRTIASIAAHVGTDRPIIRAMPNTPAAICHGMTVACSNEHVLPAQAERCIALLSAVGKVAWVDDESQLDAVTAVSGSGPAYVFLLAECLAEAGVKAGLPADLAAQLANATVHGAGELMHASKDTPATLRENVTSPGGTTEAALKVLMGDDSLCDLMTRAVAAATKRSRELSG